MRGGSKRPTLEPGERVPALRLRVRPGDLVVLRRPGEPDRVLLKRVAAVPGGAADLGEGVWVSAGAGYLVVGDNRPRSTDSRHFGPVDAGNVLGRAVYRYAPVERRGRLGVDNARDSRLG